MGRFLPFHGTRSSQEGGVQGGPCLDDPAFDTPPDDLIRLTPSAGRRGPLGHRCSASPHQDVQSWPDSHPSPAKGWHFRRRVWTTIDRCRTVCCRGSENRGPSGLGRPADGAWPQIVRLFATGWVVRTAVTRVVKTKAALGDPPMDDPLGDPAVLMSGLPTLSRPPRHAQLCFRGSDFGDGLNFAGPGPTWRDSATSNRRHRDRVCREIARQRNEMWPDFGARASPLGRGLERLARRLRRGLLTMERPKEVPNMGGACAVAARMGTDMGNATGGEVRIVVGGAHEPAWRGRDDPFTRGMHESSGERGGSFSRGDRSNQ